MAKPRIIPPAGYQMRQEVGREMVIRKGSETSLRRQGLLNPTDFWEGTSRHGHLMGRGEVLTSKGLGGEVAIRRYRHGGLLRRLTGDLFFFGSRPFQELVVTEEARSVGVPTLKILAAIKQRVWGGWYRGTLSPHISPQPWI